MQRGDGIVELGCGIGLNFPLLMKGIGPEGRVIGVDLSPEMLSCVQEQVAGAGWHNVKLVRTDMPDYEFPKGCPLWLVRLFVWLMSPFVVTFEYFDTHSWDSIARYFQEPAVEDVCGA